MRSLSLPSTHFRRAWRLIYTDICRLAYKSSSKTAKRDRQSAKRDRAPCLAVGSALVRARASESVHSTRSERATLRKSKTNEKLPKFEKTLSFSFFKGIIIHNLEFLSFQKMCGLYGFLFKTQALERSARGRSWRVADTLNSPYLHWTEVQFNFLLWLSVVPFSRPVIK